MKRDYTEKRYQHPECECVIQLDHDGAVPVIERCPLHANAPKLLEVAEIVQAMKAWLTFDKVHADWMQTEVLNKYGVVNFQAMASLAYQKAEAAIAACKPPEGQ